MGKTLPPWGALPDRVSFSPGGLGGGGVTGFLAKKLQTGPRV